MAMNKKGMFFTMIALLVVGLLVIAFSTKMDTTVKGHLPVLERRISTVNSFVSDVENIYIERMLRISTLSSFNAMMDYQVANGFFAAGEFDGVFSEIALHGTIEGALQSAASRSNMDFLLSGLTKVGKEELHVDSSFEPVAINVFQNNETGPWTVGINFTVNYVIDGELAKWEKSSNIITMFKITNLEDPVYTYNAAADFRNVIVEESFKNNWTLNNFGEHIKMQTYRYDPNAPAFLMRLIGDNRASGCCGMHSMINLKNMPTEENKNATFVDYCYWSDVCLGENYGNFIWTIKDITNEDLDRNADFYRFKLDTYHVGRYNLTESTDKACRYIQSLQKWNGTGCV
jgi:hypothetical protein